MTFVVCLATVIAEEGHGIFSVNVLGVSLDELLHAFPQCRNGLDVFVQAQHEAVLFLVVLHELEWVVLNVTEELDARFDTPVVLKLHHQRVTEEETRLESAHVSIADRVSIDDLSLSHILTNSFSLLLINP